MAGKPVVAVCRDAADDLAVTQAAAQLARLTQRLLYTLLPPPPSATSGRFQRTLHELAEQFSVALRVKRASPTIPPPRSRKPHNKPASS